MKKEKIKELFQELIEREFQIDEIAELFYHINEYLFAKRESQRKGESKFYKESWKESSVRWRKRLQEKLDDFSLDYTIEDIEQKF